MDFKEYLILLAEAVIALWVVGWSLGFAVAAVVGAFHEARHCAKCPDQELDKYDEVQQRDDQGTIVYHSDPEKRGTL
jgi:hypothetical protein